MFTNESQLEIKFTQCLHVLVLFLPSLLRDNCLFRILCRFFFVLVALRQSHTVEKPVAVVLNCFPCLSIDYLETDRAEHHAHGSTRSVPWIYSQKVEQLCWQTNKKVQ